MSEREAVYYTFLRAIEERDALLRYGEFLAAERARLDAFTQQTRAAGEELPRKVRRPIDATDKAVLEAVGRRRATVLDELGRLDDRLAAAQAFVDECETELAELRG